MAADVFHNGRRVLDLHIRIEQTLHPLGRCLRALDLCDRVGQLLHGELDEENDLQKSGERAERELPVNDADAAEAQRERRADAADREHHGPEHRGVDRVFDGVAVHRLGENGKFLGIALLADHRFARPHAHDAFIERGGRLRVRFAQIARGFEQPHLKIPADHDQQRGDGDHHQRQPPGQVRHQQNRSTQRH